jgi:C-methyltransferase C-terminal domain/Putative zinc binding domain
MTGITCRACGGGATDLVLDLGEQPPCDYFPSRADAGPDRLYPLQMWLCSWCGLAQLAADPTVPDEPRGVEPAALVAQATDAVGRAASAGLLPDGGTVAEYGSPHGGTWLGLLGPHGLTPAPGNEPADVVVDCFGMMHSANQAEAIGARAARVAPGGVLLLQYHSLETIIRCGQWNALRHGHYAYYSTTALTAMLASSGFSPHLAWSFELYGGTVLLAATRDADGPGRWDRRDQRGPAAMVAQLLAQEARIGVRDPGVLRRLERDGRAQATGLHDWLAAERSAGRTVLGYGAASRAVALLRWAGVDASLLPAVADASPAKHGRRMPGTDIPVVSPAQLRVDQPASVLLFLSDLLSEVRAAYPWVEAAGHQWVDAATLSAHLAGGEPPEAGGEPPAGSLRGLQKYA